MSLKVWMQVSSRSAYSDEELEVRYSNATDVIVVLVGSGHLFMELPIAEELFEKLREALQTGALAQAVSSGSGVWLSAMEFVPAEDVSDLQQKVVA
ncbi:hypothetical protein [Nocardia seriolae]|uniref:hypothetical protein n=1 Tax=Nocardia seriolae TaxID=37332 RepID=UPI0008FF794B|nr:hypothetical protein [Nocardia seriolae]OJF82902.1 hypothetical protein NS14008_31935 [Nocardia seriolae]PSK27143.1 hypothetical protein C6575_33470 [Nocardia seriolae]QOW32963.1 hypothetical protein IMZ23_34635 [Nocardia seriolae]QUN20575.1 hypothetical protein KEC46_15700 [Nocardia seriolae]WNJ60097.1 hypothetical protein RMO66_04595 [Nocardia seriolae]